MMESIDKMSFLCKTLFDVRIVQQRKEIEQYKQLMKKCLSPYIFTDKVRACDLETVKLLLDLGFDPNSKDVGGISALMTANTRKGKDTFLQMIRLLIEKGANVNYVSSHVTPDDSYSDCLEDSALMYYVYEDNHDDAEGMSVLLDHGANIDFQDEADCTPLMIAIRFSHINAPSTVEKIRLLLDRGANVNLRNKDGDTAYDIALENDFATYHPDILKRLQTDI